MRALLLLVPAAALFAFSTPPLSARRDDEAAVRRAVQDYFDGGRQADSVPLRRAFHPDARMLFVRDDSLAVVPIGEYIARVAGNRPKPGAVDSTERRVVSIDIAGDAAIAKLEQRRPAMLVTDYMSLLKVDGRWVIVNKIFSRSER